jgi:hypothetical protein
VGLASRVQARFAGACQSTTAQRQPAARAHLRFPGFLPRACRIGLQVWLRVVRNGGLFEKAGGVVVLCGGPSGGLQLRLLLRLLAPLGWPIAWPDAGRDAGRGGTTGQWLTFALAT